ncbi:hypothetical protein IMG5_188690 [Ichthyophthirius multifiliis]|uniref:Glutathione transferase n=1 Tax=Ichthyophthirius multifiliis TaxID=5932 RepID=G0R402_ICHMU|nr:hypothetical protein IMG5_188690 [Ichthyophthirius multifiliis]EGR27799.1 hypothetical protein IMG5_188690 [Ichthyophthirius multifiliis]|eukprot:XP_004027144.1 hypothetical protein IMG5_188690 [Ichthyophthirius multifiliis]
MSLKLYCPVGNFRANQILITADLCGVEIKHIDMEYSDSKTKEFLQKNPLGKVPVLETTEGFIFETNTIVRHLARKSHKLYGSSLYQQALVDQYLDIFQNELAPPLLALTCPVFGCIQFDKEVYKAAKTEVQTVLKIIEDRLKVSKYLTGTEVTIADIQYAVYLSYAFRTIFDEKYRQTIKHVVAWYESIAQLPQFVKYIGKLRYTIIEWVASQPEKKENKKKEGTVPPAAVQKQQQQKKDEKQKEQKSPVKQQQQSTNKQTQEPAQEQQQGGFDLYNFKTLYTNAKDKNEAVKFLIENWTSGKLCLYKAHYDKYEGEGTVLYQFNNLKSAFIQRCEAARKVAFGTYSVYGDEPNLEIYGVWLFVGDKMPEEMKENPSLEYTQWTKLDINKPEDVNTLTQYWINVEEDVSVVEGRKLRSFSCFK